MSEAPQEPVPSTPEPSLSPEPNPSGDKFRELLTALKKYKEHVFKTAQKLTPHLFPGYNYDSLITYPAIMHGLNYGAQLLMSPRWLPEFYRVMTHEYGASVRIPLVGIDKITMLSYAIFGSSLSLTTPTNAASEVSIVEKHTAEDTKLRRKVAPVLGENETVGGFIKQGQLVLGSILTSSGRPKAEIRFVADPRPLNKKRQLVFNIADLFPKTPQTVAAPASI